MSRKAKKKPGARAMLDNIADALSALPADRRAALERDLMVFERRAAYGGGKRGPKPRHGETLSVGVLVKVTPRMQDEMRASAKRLGVESIAEYLRELHALFLKSEATFRELRGPK